MGPRYFINFPIFLTAYSVRTWAHSHTHTFIHISWSIEWARVKESPEHTRTHFEYLCHTHSYTVMTYSEHRQLAAAESRCHPNCYYNYNLLFPHHTCKIHITISFTWILFMLSTLSYVYVTASVTIVCKSFSFCWQAHFFLAGMRESRWEHTTKMNKK